MYFCYLKFHGHVVQSSDRFTLNNFYQKMINYPRGPQGILVWRLPYKHLFYVPAMPKNFISGIQCCQVWVECNIEFFSQAKFTPPCHWVIQGYIFFPKSSRTLGVPYLLLFPSTHMLTGWLNCLD